MNKPHVYPSISDNTKSSITYLVFGQVFVFGHVFGVRLLFMVGVRVRSCSIIFRKSVFVFVHVRENTNERLCSLYTCSCSFIPVPDRMPKTSPKIPQKGLKKSFVILMSLRL